MGMPRQSIACAPDLRSSPPRSVWRLPLMWEKPRNLEAPPSTKVGVTQLRDWWRSPFPAKIYSAPWECGLWLHSLHALESSNMSEEQETGFNPETYTHLIPEGEEDYPDYLDEDLIKDPELGYMDEQVAAEVEKLSDEDKQLYGQIKDFTDAFYRQHGYILPLTDIVQIAVTNRYPGIPTHTEEEQERLRQELLQEARKRQASEEANVAEVPPWKIRRIQPTGLPKKIIDITGDDDPDKPTVITITPGADPYQQIEVEEEELQFIAGNETPSEEPHPDDEEGDNLSVITIDSLKDLDSQKVREIWTGMAELKEKERDYYNQLAAMVDDMTPNDIYATIQVTPRPGTTVPQCADDLLEEVGNEEIFRRILAVGYMAWQKFEANRTKKKPTPYKPSTIRDVEERFKVSKSRILDLQRGEAITREQTKLKKILKAEKKEETKSRTPTPEATAAEPSPQPAPSTSTQ